MVRQKKVRTPFVDNFTDGDQFGWVNYGGSFFVQNGEYVATHVEGREGSKSVQSSTLFSDLVYDAKVKLGSAGEAGILFRVNKLSLGADEYTGYFFGISYSDQKVVLGKANNEWTSLKTVKMDGLVADKWYQLRVMAKGANIKVYVDDMTTPKIEIADASFSSGSIGVRSYKAVARWDDILVTSLKK